MNDLIFGIDIEEIEKITGENLKVIKQWKKGTKEIPEPSLRLLRLYLNLYWAMNGKDIDLWVIYFMFLNGKTVFHHMKLELYSGDASKFGVWSARLGY